MNFDFENCLTRDCIKIDSDNLSSDKDGNKFFYFDSNKYYYKRPNLNELIGEELATIINARTVNFNIFKIDNGAYLDTVIASKDFKNPNSTYFYMYDLYFLSTHSIDDLNDLKDVCIDNFNYNYLLKNLFKMFAIDVYMGQDDRHYGNYQFELYDTKFIDLAHLYDYSVCRWDQAFRYNNCFYSFEQLDDYIELFNKYPTCLDMFKKITKVDLIKVLESIEEKHELVLPDFVFETYKQNEENAQNKLQKIIK